MFVFVAGTGPVGWISLGVSVLCSLAPGREGLVLKFLTATIGIGYLAYQHIPEVRENEYVQRGLNWIVRGLGLDMENRGNYNGENKEVDYSIIKSLPIEEYTEVKDLGECNVRTLRRKLERRGVNTKDCVEKSDLIEKLKNSGSSAESCAVCCEDYVTGDVLRVLPKCKHMFHISCIDKWLMESLSKGRAATCPLCKTPL
mmetsp:Transcript_6620/g.10147  ORF Transcript_6620/g.10147 Transcript_6620/m.10147 type:complete len:200 (-) Transcript_6620:213-812(-)